jgi:cell division protein FtsW
MVCGVAIFSYVNFPHVAERIDGFMSENTGYQVSRSLEAYQSGGLFGTGPGEGTVKRHLPDAHTDFIFAVAGEEFGLIACGFIVLVMAGVVFFSVRRIWAVKDMFILLAASGLLLQFSLQSLVNIGVTLNLLPTKGMTLPFISYGGSSTLALAIMAGFLLIFTRKRFGGE